MTEGTTAPRFAAVRDAFEQNLADGLEHGGAVAVWLDGQPVVDLWGGTRDLADRVPWQRDTLVNVWSVGKGVVALAVAMLVVTALLVINTIRVAAHSRRREVGIMRLVGASNFMIRMPFLLEAAVSAAIGGLIAVGALVAAKVFLIDQVLAPAYRFTAFVSWDQVIVILPIVFLTGILIAAIAAMLTLRRYLRV